MCNYIYVCAGLWATRPRREAIMRWSEQTVHGLEAERATAMSRLHRSTHQFNVE